MIAREQEVRLEDFEDITFASTILRFNDLRLTTRIIPADGVATSGDWCESFRVSSDIVALSIGDVCGHGAPTVPTMRLMRRLLREAAGQGLGPSQMLAVANFALCELEPHLYVTAIAALFDTRRREFRFANAGRPPPLLTCSTEQRFLGPSRGSLLLGVNAGTIVPEQTVRMPANALLVLYTDGVTERYRDGIHGQEDLRNAAMFAHHYSTLPAASVIERQMFLTGPNNDDAAILAVRTPESRMTTAR